MNRSAILRKLFCDLPPEPDCPLRLKPGVAQALLEDEMYHEVPADDLVAYAQQRLKSCPVDRATAIAVLKGAY